MTVVISATWFAPQPQHTHGLIVNYGPPRVAAANARYHGYTLDGYKCGGAAMNPLYLGRTIWLRAEGDEWQGPCLVVDTSSRVDFYANVFVRDEIFEVDAGGLALLTDNRYGVKGEMWIGPCPPNDESVAVDYRPPLRFDWSDPYSIYLDRYWPFPEQEPLKVCRNEPVGKEQ